MNTTSKRLSRTSVQAAVLSYACMVLLGAIVTIINATLSQLSGALNTPANRVSILISCIGLGRLVSQVLCGVLSDRMGRKRLAFLGGVMLVAFFILMPLMHSFAAVFAMCIWCGVGYGLINTTMIALLFDCFGPAGKGALSQSYVQTLYAFGGIVIPMGASLLLQSGLNWTYLYYGCAAYTALLTVCMCLIPFPEPFKRPAGQLANAEYRPSLRREGMLLAATVFFLYGAQTIGLTWLPSLAQERTGMGTAQAIRILSLYNLSAALFSLVIARLLLKKSPLLFLTVHPIISTVMFALCLITTRPTLFTLAVFAAGAVTAITFNLTVGVGGTWFPDRAGTISGMISTASSFSSLVLPAITSFMLDHMSVSHMFLIMFVLLGGGFALVMKVRRCDARILRGATKSEGSSQNA